MDFLAICLLPSLETHCDLSGKLKAASKARPLFVVLSRRRDRNIQSADRVDFVVIDLRENDLLFDA